MRKSGQHCDAELEKDAPPGSQASIEAKFRSIRRRMRHMRWMLLVTFLLLMIILIK